MTNIIDFSGQEMQENFCLSTGHRAWFINKTCSNTQTVLPCNLFKIMIGIFFQTPAFFKTWVFYLPQFCLPLTSSPRLSAMTALLYHGAPFPVLSNTRWPFTNLAPTPTWSTTPAAPTWPSPAWILAPFMPLLVMHGTSRAERERTVCTSTRQHVRLAMFFLNLKMITQVEVTSADTSVIVNIVMIFIGF